MNSVSACLTRFTVAGGTVAAGLGLLEGAVELVALDDEPAAVVFAEAAAACASARSCSAVDHRRPRV